MDTPAASLAGYGYLMAATLHGALTCRLALSGTCSSRRANVTALAYLGAIAATAAWGASGFLSQHWTGPILPVVGAAFDLLRYALWFAFALLLLRAAGAGRLRKENRILTALASLVIVGGAAVLIADVTTLHGLPRQAGGIGSYIGLAQAVIGLILVEQLFRNAAEDSRWKLKPLCLGLACVFTFDFYLASEAVMLVRRTPEAMSVRGGVHAVTVPLLLLASSRGSDWLKDLRLSRLAAFRSTALLLTGAYLLLISGIGYYVRYFGGDWGAALQIVFSLAALIVLVILVSSGTVQAKLRVFLGKHFFSYRYDYREEWLKFTALLSSRTAPQEMGALVIRGLADMVESPGAALWSRNPGDSEFVRTAHWNFSALETERLPSSSAFTDYLQRHGGVLDLQALREGGLADGRPEVPAWLAACENAWLVVPLVVGSELVGLAVLARARTVVDVDWEVTELLATASRQAASFLAQMRATESLLEVRKFDAFNRMSAFVVHDLKNIVTQLSLMLKNARRLHDNPEFQRDMLETVESSLEKMRQLMLQLREGEAPAGVQSGVDLVAIARRIEAVAADRGRRLEVEMAERLMTRGHEDRIERVIGHVVQNALDATDASGRVWLRLRRASGQARVEVGDTGHGMSPDFIRNRLFKPFNTTKATGMGIGAYESFQYVKELGGTISVESQPDKGTVMTILMPLFESRQASDLQQLQDEA